eukprot:6175135-Pleurochrysis_carterae.AAC.3
MRRCVIFCFRRTKPNAAKPNAMFGLVYGLRSINYTKPSEAMRTLERYPHAALLPSASSNSYAFILVYMLASQLVCMLSTRRDASQSTGILAVSLAYPLLSGMPRFGELPPSFDRKVDSDQLSVEVPSAVKLTMKQNFRRLAADDDDEHKSEKKQAAYVSNVSACTHTLAFEKITVAVSSIFSLHTSADITS